MKVMINGYGEGAFETLRFKLDPTSGHIDPNAVHYPYKITETGLTMLGCTLKVALQSSNNAMTLTLHDMSVDEAVTLARKLLEYASYLAEIEKQAST